jgi:chloramphenicol 3-O phosphotransferase
VAGSVLFINGASSSGKTSLCRSLQALWPGPLAMVGVDTLISMLPAAYAGFGERAAEGYPFRIEKDPEGRRLTRARTGPAGRILNRRMAEFVAGCAADGLDVVVDHVVLEPEDFEDFAAALDPVRSWLIGVRCDLDVLELREKARGDRAPNLAREQAERVHAGGWRYDLTLDSTSEPPHVLARRVLDLAGAGEARALAEYRTGLAAGHEVPG